MRNILLILIVLIPGLAFSQTSRQQIKELKNGVLLVRLKTSEKVIQGLKEMGHFDMAEEIRQDQREENLEIAAAFKESYDFSPVCFFYSDCTRDIKEGNYDGCIMDHGLNKISSMPENIGNYLVAEFSHVQRSDEAYFQDYTLRQDTSGYKTQQKTYTGDTDLGPYALIVRDRDFVQLRSPFPYYVRTYEGFPILRRKKPKTVARLNEALHEYYSKTVK